MRPTVLPLYVHPSADPQAWQAVAVAGGTLTVVIDDYPEFDQAAAVIGELAGAGVSVLGRVEAGYATRPLADLLDGVAGWADRPVCGVFLDQAPTSPFSLGPIALAVRLARRSGLPEVVLNPGIPTDPLYRELGVPICSFEGPWPEYRRWSGEGARPGDGHLVHSVPAAELLAARALLRARGAGWGLVTDRCPPAPYAGLPAWLPAPTGTTWPASRVGLP